MHTKTPLEKAVVAAGGQTALARKLTQITGKKYRQSVIGNWLTRERVPAESTIPVEKATGISRHDLRPDIYPREEVDA